MLVCPFILNTLSMQLDNNNKNKKQKMEHGIEMSKLSSLREIFCAFCLSGSGCMATVPALRPNCLLALHYKLMESFLPMTSTALSKENKLILHFIGLFCQNIWQKMIDKPR
jgi:hypothetical protein